MRSFTIILAGALGAAALPAHADQCQSNQKGVAEKALALVKPGSMVVELCEPCHDTTPGKPYKVNTVAVKDGELQINGAGVDLAYVYLQTGTDEFSNLGLAVSCGASRVSEKIVNGKPSGVKAPTTSTRPPMPPPPPRASSADELAGTWDVQLHTRFSSCSGIAHAGVAAWTIAPTRGGFTLDGSDGTKLSGSLDPIIGNLFKLTMKPAARPSSAGLQLTMFLKDRISGTFTLIEQSKNAKDPVCFVQMDVMGKRH